jgi:Kelch motif
VQVRTGPDDWIEATEPPFGDRTEPTIVTTGTKLLVIGGYDESHPDPLRDTWIAA